MVILRGQVNLSKNGLVELSLYLDGPETEMLVWHKAFMPDRLKVATDKLRLCSQQEIEVLRKLVLQGRTPAAEIFRWYMALGITTDLYR